MRTPVQGLASRLPRPAAAPVGEAPRLCGLSGLTLAATARGRLRGPPVARVPPTPLRRGTVGRLPCPRSLPGGPGVSRGTDLLPTVSHEGALSPSALRCGQPPRRGCVQPLREEPRVLSRGGSWADQKLVLSDSFIHRPWSSDLDQVQVMGDAVCLACCKAIKMKFCEAGSVRDWVRLALGFSVSVSDPSYHWGVVPLLLV